MPRGGKIKSKVVQSSINNETVVEMFHGVLGTGEETEFKLEIVYPKYLQIVQNCTRFVNLLDALCKSGAMGFFAVEQKNLAEYVGYLRDQMAESFTAPDLAALHPPAAGNQLQDHAAAYGEVTPDEYAKFAAVYKAVKECSLVNMIVVTCKNLVTHKKFIGDQQKLNDRFLTKSAGLTFAPLADHASLNLKKIYNDDRLSPDDRRLVLMVMHKMLAISHDVYSTMSSPDIDVGEFVQVIMSSIDDVRKHIPRCDEAFDKIKDSVGLLKGNFGDYYKDYVASNNPTIIMENFVLDVSQGTKSSPRVTAQFRKIISHYRKIASQQSQNPKLQALFQQVDANVHELEKESRNADEAEDSSADESSGEDVPDPSATSSREHAERLMAAMFDGGESLADEFAREASGSKDEA